MDALGMRGQRHELLASLMNYLDMNYQGKKTWNQAGL